MQIELAAVLSNSGLVRDGLVAILKSIGAPNVLSFRRGAEVVDCLESHKLEILVVDLSHQADEPRALLQSLRAHPKSPRMLAFGSPVQLAACNPYVDVLLEAVNADTEALLRCLNELPRNELARADGQGHVERISAAPIREGSCPAREDPREWSKVTSRQREVLGWLSQGADNERIAKILHISVRTVKAHVSSLMRRFDVENRTELALLANEVGLRPPPWSFNGNGEVVVPSAAPLAGQALPSSVLATQPLSTQLV